MGNTLIVVGTILIIVIIGHLYIKNMVLNDNNDNNYNNVQNVNLNETNIDKKVSFGENTIRLIHNNQTLTDINSITPPDNINISETPLESQLKEHIDSIYKPEKIVYNEKVYKKDTLTGYAEKTLNSFSDFGSNTDYYPYNKNERNLINKYNNHSSAHFTDDNFDLNSFFNKNQRFNDTTSAFVDNAKYDNVKGELNKSNTLIAPPLIVDDTPCQPYNQVIENKTQAQLKDRKSVV